MTSWKNIFFGVIISLLLLPSFLGKYPFISDTNLKGAFYLSEKPVFEWDNWYDGSFQDSMVPYLNDHFGFRNTAVRLSNQYDYSLFGLLHAEGIIEGKGGQFYEEDYIKEYLGIYDIGQDAWQKKVVRIRFLSDTLQQLGIDLVVIIEPGKASFYPEYLPEKYQNVAAKTSNYDRFTSLLKENNIAHLDFYKVFDAYKDTASYPVYPRAGIHWSTYGMALATDSMFRYLTQKSGKQLGPLEWDEIEISRDPRYSDYDLGETMNLLFKLNRDELAYPQFKFRDIPKEDRPAILVIGDSYYFNIQTALIPQNHFREDVFWLYNKKIYPQSYVTSTSVNPAKTKDEILKQDIVLLMITERFMHTFLWGFVDNAYKAFKPDYVPDRIYDAENHIRFSEGWFKKMVDSAYYYNQSLESRINLEAWKHYAGTFEAIPDKSKEDWVLYYSYVIKNDTGWYKSIIEGATNRNIPVDEFLTSNAEYLYYKNFEEKQ